ncbi:hypothetical protein NB723_000539 [Xanthomonas sacchari]|nr:hypothetical protein [Xanthomonas sacchari]
MLPASRRDEHGPRHRVADAAGAGHDLRRLRGRRGEGAAAPARRGGAGQLCRRTRAGGLRSAAGGSANAAAAHPARRLPRADPDRDPGTQRPALRVLRGVDRCGASEDPGGARRPRQPGLGQGEGGDRAGHGRAGGTHRADRPCRVRRARRAGHGPGAAGRARAQRAARLATRAGPVRRGGVAHPAVLGADARHAGWRRPARRARRTAAALAAVAARHPGAVLDRRALLPRRLPRAA